jgi:hypothetical protein
MTTRDAGTNPHGLDRTRDRWLAGLGLLGLGLALLTVGCRERGAPSAGPPPSAADDAAPPPDGHVPPPPPPDAPPSLGLGPYANLHADFVARCPITLPEPDGPSSRPSQEHAYIGPAGRGCKVRERDHVAFFGVTYTAVDDVHSYVARLGKEERYRRVVGNVDAIQVAYRKGPPVNVALCQTIPDQLARLYQHISSISDEATARLVTTLRQVDKLEAPRAYARIQIDNRVVYASIDLGPRDPKDATCFGSLEAGLTLAHDPVIVDVPLN